MTRRALDEQQTDLYHSVIKRLAAMHDSDCFIKIETLERGLYYSMSRRGSLLFFYTYRKE